MAISTMKVSAVMGESFSTQINCSHPFVIDQPKMAGGNDEGPNPLEIFLASLPACICALGRIIAMQRGFTLRGMNVSVEGDIDKDFLMGKTTEGRAGFTEIRTHVNFDADLTLVEKENLMNEIAARCPVADNMKYESEVTKTLVEEMAINN